MRYAELAKDAVPIRDVDGDGTLESDDVEPGQKSRSELYLDLTQEVAPKYGLHLIDPTERVKRLQSADNVQAVLDELQSHMGDLGIPIVLHETLDSKDARVDAEPFDPNSLEMSQDLIDGVSSFIYSTSYVPKELYEFIDIKEIRIVDTFKPTDNPIVGEFTAAGKAMMDDGIIYLPKSYLLQGDFDLIMHEVSHLLDYRLNGDSYDATYEDQEFTALNKEEFDYGDPNEDMSDMVALYSATNPVEDKATLMETMINGLSRVYLYHENPIIRNKYRLLLGRIEQNVPGYSQYMLSIIEHKRIPAPEYS